MKKNFVRLLSLSLLVIMMLTMLVSCGSTYGKIEKNFKEIGYLPVEEVNETATKIAEELAVADEEGNKVKLTAHVFKKDGDFIDKYAIVLEFSSEGDIDTALGNSETLKGFVKDAQKSEYVNGNCVLVPLTITEFNTLKEAFKK